VLFVGLIIYSLFTECINRAPSLIIQNISYVKKVVFPLEILPWIALGSALFHAGISVFVLIAMQLILNGNVYWTALFLPLILLPYIILTLGIAWFLSATGVFVRDIGQAIGMLTSVLLFISPIFYPISVLPPALQTATMLNPLTLIIEESRKVLLFGQLPDWHALFVYLLIALLVAWIGFFWFQKTRKWFADVL